MRDASAGADEAKAGAAMYPFPPCGPLRGRDGEGGRAVVALPCPIARPPPCRPPRISAFARVHSRSKTGVNALTDALWGGGNDVARVFATRVTFRLPPFAAPATSEARYAVSRIRCLAE